MKFTFISETCTPLEQLEKEAVQEIYDRMAHAIKNFDVLEKVALAQARTEEERRAVEERFNADEIQCDLDSAYDEFYFLLDGKYLDNGFCCIEVVTKEVAESNDMDWITGTPSISLEERKTYKVGEVLSDYSKLDDKYYFKFM